MGSCCSHRSLLFITSNKLNPVFYRRSKHKPKITREMVCAGNEEADACSGDSGSPLLWLNTELRWMVGGVVSFGPSSCGSKAPGVYAKVETSLDWIRSQISRS